MKPAMLDVLLKIAPDPDRSGLVVALSRVADREPLVITPVDRPPRDSFPDIEAEPEKAVKMGAVLAGIALPRPVRTALISEYSHPDSVRLRMHVDDPLLALMPWELMHVG